MRSFYPDGKEAFDEGHGFSRAEKDCPMRALAPEVRSYRKASTQVHQVPLSIALR
jgi:hypothetical protein